MVELSLPRNSKVTKGKRFKADKDAKKVKTFSLYRYDPDSKENPRLDSYEVDMDSCGDRKSVV